MGFHLDHDVRPTADLRVVHLTPPGSACSIALGVVDSAPGSLRGLHPVATDIEAAHAELVARGVEPGPVTRLGPGDGGAFVFLADPDGNPRAVQEIRASAGGAAPG